jgi:DNA-3-methyladenine glycosylase
MSEASFGELMETTSRVQREFYDRDPVRVARECLGKILVHGQTVGRIVEVEAYLGVDDEAAHAWRGITKRTEVLFGRPGHAYVYFIYGMYECLNFVTEPEGRAGSVLIRALEPVSGLARMRKRRPTARRVEDLASGPGKLTRALGITRKLDGSDLVSGPLQVRAFENERAPDIAITRRIGITRAADRPLRFVIRGSQFTSGKRID